MNNEERMIRFITCGHVDDGKSTLIGRLLYEMGMIPDDQLAGATTGGVLDYARLTDGLEDERTQGITIDVAYRYFHKAGRHYRIADTPGHIQYLRNMAVAAVDSDAAMLLVDAVHGVREQTLRHSHIAAFFGVKHLVVVVNKMDLVEFARGRFDEIAEHFKRAMQSFPDITLTFIPVSALNGDNVATRSSQTLWYQGPTLRDYLEQFTPPPPVASPMRFPVQHVVRITDTVRGYQGTLAGSRISVGDKVAIADTGTQVDVIGLYHDGRIVSEAQPGDAITVVLKQDVDLARGGMLCDAEQHSSLSDHFYADIFWLNIDDANVQAFQGILKLAHRQETTEITIDRFDGPIGHAEAFTASPVAFDAFAQQPRTGLFMLIEPETEKVVGIGKALHAHAPAQQFFTI